jgi:hypothetical protein
MGSAEPAQTPGATPVDGATRARELEIVREIANAFLTATSALEVYRLALIRAMPLVGASFGSVFLRDPVEPELLRLECAHNWPQPSARFLGQMRIRVGRGPTGRAVAEHRPIEADDIFADPALRDWWEPARELAFTVRRQDLVELFPAQPPFSSTSSYTPRSVSSASRATAVARS